MRIFGILLAVAFVSHFTPMEAHNQQRQVFTQKKEKKTYVNAENLYFGNEGIFWQASQNNWVPVSGVGCDSHGIYLTGSKVTSFTYYVCNNCDWHYEKRPSQCQNPECQGTSFHVEYEDIWDRG